MEAFNASGQLVDSDIKQNRSAQWVQLSVSGSDITRVVLTEIEGRSAFVYDDLAFTTSAGPDPITSNGAIVNAASGVGGMVAPGEFVTIYGEGIGPSQPTVAESLAKGLGETRVLGNGIEAFLTFTSSAQVNALVPYAVSGSANAEFQIENKRTKSTTFSVAVANAAPGIFTLDASGTGPAVVVNQDNRINSQSNPASRGSVVTLFATGQGQTNPRGIDGAQPYGPPFPKPVLPVSVAIGGIVVPPADLLFSGLVYAGVLQVNVSVPSTVTPGSSVDMVLTIGNTGSRTGVTLAVQ